MSLNGFAVSVLKVGFGNDPLFPFNAQATRSGRFRGVPLAWLIPLKDLRLKIHSAAFPALLLVPQAGGA